MKFNLILLAIAGCLLAALVPIRGTDVWYSQFVAVSLFGLLLVGAYISDMSKAIGLLFCYLVFSTIFIAHQDTMALVCLFQVALCLIVARSISNFDDKQRKKIWLVLGGLLILQVGWGFLQMFNLDPIFKLSTNTKLCDTVGFSGSHNQYGLFMAATSPFAFLHPFLLPFVFIALILSKTFSAALGFMAAAVFFFRNKFDVFLMLICAVILAFAFTQFTHKSLDGKLKERIALWGLTINQTLKGKALMTPMDNPNVSRVVTCAPWFGFGFQKFFTISPYTQKPIIAHNNTHRYEHAHNDYVEALFDLGIIGFLLVLMVILEIGFLYMFPWRSMSFVRPLGMEMATAGLIAFGVCALSIYTVHTACNGFLLCVLLGLFYGEVNDGKKRRKQGSPCLVSG